MKSVIYLTSDLIKASRRRFQILLSLLLVLLFFNDSGTASSFKSRIFRENPTFSQENNNSEPALTLEKCLEIALLYNPLILSSHEQYLAARARINIARSFPQPEILLDYPLQPKFFSPGRSEEKFFWVYQTIEFPGRRYFRTRVASLEASEQAQDNESLKLDVAFQVKEAFFGLLLVEEQLKYARENLELSREFVEMVEVKHSAGEVSRAELLRAQVEMAQAEANLKRYEIELEIMAARLNVLLGRDKNQAIKISGELKQPFLRLSLEEAREAGLALRPEIRKTEYALKRISFQKQQALLNYFPDFNLGFARHQVEGVKYWNFSLGISVPLFFWQTKKGELAEAEASLKAVEKELIYWQNMVSLEIEEAFRQVVCCEEQIKLFSENILKQAEEVYQLFLFSFKEGQIGGLDLIEARRTRIESKTAYAEQLYQHAVSLAALSRAMGKIQ